MIYVVSCFLQVLLRTAPNLPETSIIFISLSWLKGVLCSIDKSYYYLFLLPYDRISEIFRRIFFNLFFLAFLFIIIANQYFKMEFPNNQSESSNLPLDPLASLRGELTAMQFDEHLIEQALKRTNNLEKAIEIIISIMEEGDSQHPKVDCPRLLLLVRMDLKMGVGKVAAQCGHACLRAYQMARSKAFKDEEYSLVFVRWLQSGQQKTVYRVQDEEQLFRVIDRFKAMGVETCYIRDAGRTQISAGTATVGAVGPFSSHKMQTVTKDLSVL